jgi:hypothetical protein
MALICIEIDDKFLEFKAACTPLLKSGMLPLGTYVRPIVSTMVIAMAESIYYIRQGSIYKVKDRSGNALQEPKADDQE